MIRHFLLICLGLFTFSVGATGAIEDERRLAKQYMQEKKHEEALLLWEKLLVEVDDSDSANDLAQAGKCLQETMQLSEREPWLRECLREHEANWRFWSVAADLLTQMDRVGVIKGGIFIRGAWEGGMSYDSTDRDRVEAFQWKMQAWEKGGSFASKWEKSHLVESISRLVQRGNPGWMLGVTPFWAKHEIGAKVVIVDPELDFESINHPIYIPKTPKEAKNDGELYRWAIDQARQLGRRPPEEFEAALGEAFMQHYGIPRGHAVDWYAPDEELEMRLRKLRDDELIEEGKVKKLVKENQFMPYLKKMALSKRPKDHAAERAREKISEFRRTRLQYDQLAGEVQDWLSQLPEQAGDRTDADVVKEKQTPRQRWQQELEDLVSPHLHIPTLNEVYPLGKQPEYSLLVQNSKDIFISGRPIALEKIVQKMERYLRSNPERLDAKQTGLRQLKQQLLDGAWRDQLGEEAFRHRYLIPENRWHRPMARKVRLPLDRAGPWLITYELGAGNIQQQIVWVSELSIVLHEGGKQNHLMVVDSLTGEPVPRAKVTALGWQVEPLENPTKTRNNRVIVSKVEQLADEQGALLFKEGTLSHEYDWMLWAKSEDGRLAVMPELALAGLDSNEKSSPYHLNAYCMVDRPGYRQGNLIQAAIWLKQTTYHQGSAPQLPTKITLQVETPEQEVLDEIELETGADGKMEWKWRLPKDARAGAWLVRLVHKTETEEKEVGGFRFFVDHVETSVPKVTPQLEKTHIKRGDAQEIRFQVEGEADKLAEAKLKVRILRQRVPNLAPVLHGWGWCFPQKFPSTVPEEWGEERVLDLQGPGEYRLPLTSSLEVLGDDPMMHELYLIEADLEWNEEKLFTGYVGCWVHPKDTWVQLSMDRGFLTTNTPSAVKIFVKQPMANEKKTKIQIAISRRSGLTEYRQLLTKTLDLDEAGNVLLPLKLSVPGNYRIRASLSDEIFEDMELACVDENGGGAPVLLENAQQVFAADKEGLGILEVKPERVVFENTDTVRVLVRSRWPEQDVAVYYGSLGGDWKWQWVRTSNYGAIMNLELDPSMKPNAFVEAHAVRRAKLSRYRQEIRVAPEKSKLQVELADYSATIDGASEAELLIQTRDAQGQPKRSEVVVTVYDERLEALGSRLDELPQRAFWAWKNLPSGRLHHSMQSYGSHGYIDITGRMAGDLELEVDSRARELEGLAYREDDLMEMPSLPLPQNWEEARKAMPQPVYWNANLETDEQGVLKLPIPLPQGTGRWRVHVWAIDSQAACGHATRFIVR